MTMRQLHTVAPLPSSSFTCKRRLGLFQDPSVFKTFTVTTEEFRSATYVVNRYPPLVYSYPSPSSSKSNPRALPAIFFEIQSALVNFRVNITLITRAAILRHLTNYEHIQKDYAK